MIPEEIVRAVFLKWEIDARQNPTRYSVREEMAKLPVDKVADKMTKYFMNCVNDMGVDHK